MILKSGKTYPTLAHTERWQPRVLQTVVKPIVRSAGPDRNLWVDAVVFTKTHEQWYGRELRAAFAKASRPLGCHHETSVRGLYWDLDNIYCICDLFIEGTTQKTHKHTTLP